MRLCGSACALAALLLCSVSPAAEKTTSVYRGAKVLTAADRVFDPGVLIVEDGKIARIGTADEVSIPDGAEVHDVSGRVIIPGLVDSHSHLGVYSRPAVAASQSRNWAPSGPATVTTESPPVAGSSSASDETRRTTVPSA